MKKIYFAFTILLLSLATNAQTFTDSLILDLPMDGDAVDISGNINNGTLYKVVGDTSRDGNPTGALRFNGVDSYIEIPASPSMNKIQTSNEITITAWINIRQWYNNVNVFSVFERYNANTDGGFLLEANWAGGGILFLADETNTNYAPCNFSWNFGQWYHLGFTYSQSEGRARFYVDGVKVCDTAYAANINVTDTTAPFAIGRSLAGPDEYTDGKIDDLKVYYRALAAQEIDTIFTTGIEEKKLEREFAIYPNPATEKLVVSAKGNAAIQNISIQNVLGATVYTAATNFASTTEVNTSNLSPGIYFVTLQIGGKQVTRKFMKE